MLMGTPRDRIMPVRPKKYGARSCLVRPMGTLDKSENPFPMLPQDPMSVLTFTHQTFCLREECEGELGSSTNKLNFPYHLACEFVKKTESVYKAVVGVSL